MFFSSCSNNNTSENNQTTQVSDSVFGNRLIKSSFLIYGDSLTVDTLKEQIMESFNIYDDRSNKIFHVDAEELAEFQFDFFLPRLNNILKKRNFKLDVKTADNYETSNEIILNGEKIRLYTKDQMENGDFWDIASRTFFKKLNRLITKENSAESFFLLYQGNDLHALLLTDEQFDIIAEKYKSEPKEIPYRP